MANALTPVEFHGASLFVTIIDNAPFVAVKPICEALGLVWNGQLERIKRHSVLSQGMRVTRMPSASGEQESVCLPLDKLNGWLFGVSVGRVKPELRERLTQYQSECFDVLAQHFGVKPGVSTMAASAAPESHFSIDTLIALITGGLIDHGALLRLANESGMALYKDVANTKDAPWGEAVAAQINASLPQSDLRGIVNKAVLELWTRNLATKNRPVPQRNA